MTDRPILFSAPMVRALLDGTKTQTRRMLKEQPELFKLADKSLCKVGCMQVDGDAENRVWLGSETAGVLTAQKIRYAIGDRLWVRETWRTHKVADELPPRLLTGEGRVWYEADRDNCDAHGKTRVSIHMPRWASRLTLTVTEVRVERLQDISEEDAIAEGVRRILPQGHPDDRGPYHYAVDMDCGSLSGVTAANAFASLWDHINGPDAWCANPWVVAVSFEVHQCNIDQLHQQMEAA